MGVAPTIHNIHNRSDKMSKIVARFIRLDGVTIERMIEEDMPYVSLVRSERIGPWVEGSDPFCPVTLTPQIFERRGDGKYIETMLMSQTAGMEDIFPSAGICKEAGKNPGQNPDPGTLQMELDKLFGKVAEDADGRVDP